MSEETGTPIETRYDPRAVEDRWYAFWEERGLFRADATGDGDAYVIVIPPPNVTGVLHMGHALNNTFQDVLIRFRRMQGRNTLWMPGTDHAGIATQNVVEKGLRKEGKTRHDLGREAFLERVWDWRERNGATIIRQLRRLGASCDWARECFTMDEVRSRAVRESFVRLYEDGLIYRGEYLVNWCPRCATALSDEEAVHQEVEGGLYRIRYPVKGQPGRFVTVATTRPETMLGDTAVAVNPEDARFADLVGKTVILPLVEREIPIIADAYVDPAFGTGCLKITPAHDPNDFQIGGRHGLPRVNVFHPDGRVNEHGGRFDGMDRFEARKAVLEALEAEGLYEGKSPHRHQVAHCQRCDTMLEPYLSTQWFVRMQPLAESAIAAVREGRVRFVPDRWTKTYYDWLENIRDWCISRQLWWGHRIPVWHCRDCKGETCARTDPTVCGRCGSRAIEQDADVLDTWFSSWLWPFSTMGWPEDTPEMRAYYPGDVLVTGPDIIFFWVARMVMAGLRFTGKEPFHTVYLHGIVKDEKGEKMSKSKGNAVDPLEMIDRYSADALRFSLILLTAEGQDCKLSVEKFEMGRNFTNKLWNASRFVLTNIGDEPGPLDPTLESLAFEDRWILSRLAETTGRVTEALDAYRFNEALRSAYHFVWNDFCDWYVELVKPRLGGEDVASRRAARATLACGLDRVLRLLHPVVPFVTEEIWQRLRERGIVADTAPALIVARFPAVDRARLDPALDHEMGCVQDAIRAVRHIRQTYGIPDARPVTVIATAKEAADVAPLERHGEFLLRLAGVERVTAGPGLARPEGAATAVVGKVEVHLPLAGVIDLDAERRRLDGLIQKEETNRERIEDKLANRSFVEKAPAEVVEIQRGFLRKSEETLATLRRNLAELG